MKLQFIRFIISVSVSPKAIDALVFCKGFAELKLKLIGLGSEEK